MPTKKQKFSSRVDPDLLREMKKIAIQEGKQFQIVIDEAFCDFVLKKNLRQPSENVIEAFNRSVNEHDELYKLLSK